MRVIESPQRSGRDALWAALALAGVLLLADAALMDVFEGLELSDLVQIVLIAAALLVLAWAIRRHRDAMEAQRASARRQEQLIDDASHELRAPVTIARGHLELLGTGAAPEIDVALDELSRMERIVDRLLLLARVGRSEVKEATPVDLVDFLEEVFIRWAGVARRGWKLGYVAPGTLVVDATALRTALDALLENAVTYTRPAAAIILRARSEGTSAVIEVIDHGCGVDVDSARRIFERFARTDEARVRDQEGTGLGLAIVDAIAKAHGGECAVRSSGGETVFALRLPGFFPDGPQEEPDPEISERPPSPAFG